MKMLYHPKRRNPIIIYRGYLYNYYFDSRLPLHIAPLGWHVPTKAEWDILISYCGGNSVAGGKLKEIGDEYWSYDSGATNDFGFSARPGGTRGSGSYFDLTTKAQYLTSTESSANFYFVELFSSSNTITTSNVQSKSSGVSIRLIKDDSTDTGTMTGNDGKIYPTVTIGTQVWMAANLAETKYRTGENIEFVEDAETWKEFNMPAMCAYNNDYSIPCSNATIPDPDDLWYYVMSSGTYITGDNTIDPNISVGGSPTDWRWQFNDYSEETGFSFSHVSGVTGTSKITVFQKIPFFTELISLDLQNDHLYTRIYLEKFIVFSDSGVSINLSNNPFLYYINLPTSTGKISSFIANGCSLRYVNFTTIPNALNINNSLINLKDNSMTVDIVNHILYDFASMVSGESVGGDYTGRYIDIGGTNADPNGSSGGYDGLTAKTSLEGKGITVIIT